VSVPAQTIVDELAPSLELAFTDPPSALVCEVATELGWTRDPFDRLISAQAIATRTTLVTKDRTIRQHVSLAWWASAP